MARYLGHGLEDFGLQRDDAGLRKGGAGLRLDDADHLQALAADLRGILGRRRRRRDENEAQDQRAAEAGCREGAV